VEQRAELRERQRAERLAAAMAAPNLAAFGLGGAPGGLLSGEGEEDFGELDGYDEENGLGGLVDTFPEE
jgi:hypothetical protein